VISLKADAEAAMEKLAAGFEKTESGLRYQFIQRRRKSKLEKQCPYI
jgi:peptidyl-prolyl cis-trans isomerase A (cyclophilin A)